MKKAKLFLCIENEKTILVSHSNLNDELVISVVSEDKEKIESFKLNSKQAIDLANCINEIYPF